MGTRPGGIVVLVGVIIFFVGAILLQTATIIESPEREDFEDDDDPGEAYNDADETYDDTIRNLYGIGKMLNWVGVMIIVLPLYLIGITGDEMDWKVRASMLSAGTALIITTMIMLLFTSSPIV
jgi:uncharacterized membrane protein